MITDGQHEVQNEIQMFSPPRKRRIQTQLDGYLIQKNTSKSKARRSVSSKTSLTPKSTRRKSAPLSPIFPSNDGTGGFKTASGLPVEEVIAKQRKKKQSEAVKRVFDDDITPQNLFLPDDAKQRDAAMLHPPHDEMRITAKVLSSPESMGVGFADDPVLTSYRLGRVKKERADAEDVPVDDGI